MAAVLGGIGVILAAWFGIDMSTGQHTTQQSEKTSTSASAKVTAQPSARHSSAASAPAKAKEGQCPVATLPGEAKPVIDGILAGKKPKYPENDGVRFGNYEGQLPKENSNYYREYTVDTPGLNHRGERRIITGGGTTQNPDVWYYTDNHYESFCEIPDAE